MSNYLKNSLFCLLILMMPYMNSESKAMNDEDYEGSSVRVHKVSLMTDDQKDVSSSVKNSVSSQIESLEDSKVSWASYLISPVKTTVQMANEFMNLATRNPKLAMAVGFTYMVSTAAAGCACYCFNNGPKFYGVCASDMAGCITSCSQIGFQASYCINNDKGC